MRIAVFHNLPSGGAKRAVYELVKALSARGHSLHEFRLQNSDGGFLGLGHFTTGETVFPFAPLAPIRAPIPGVGPHINAFRRIATLARLRRASEGFARQIDAQGFDVVWVNDCIISLKPFLLRYLKAPHVFYTHHGATRGRYATREQVDGRQSHSFVDRARRICYAPSQTLAAEYETRNETQNAQAAGYVLTNSYFSAESYLEHYGVSARVVYLGVDADRFCPASGARSDYVLAVGALIYHKGYRFLVRAIGRLPETIRPRLLIVANSVDPVEQAVVCNLASSLGVNINVQQIWNDIELAEAYRKARAFVYAPMLEPFGLAVLESMACGTPVIAVKEGGPRESVRDGETGILAERDPQSFAGALERILGDDALRQRMGRACVECARTEWTWQRSAEQLEFHMRQAME